MECRSRRAVEVSGDLVALLVFKNQLHPFHSFEPKHQETQ